MRVILALGIANLIGDGLSMALGDYISSKSEGEFATNERKIGQSVKEKDFTNRPGVIEGQCNDLLVVWTCQYGLGKRDDIF